MELPFSKRSPKTLLAPLAKQAAKYLAILSFDAFSTGLALQGALFLRFDGRIPTRWLELTRLALVPLVAARLLAVVATRLHRWSFRMSGFAEAVRLVVAGLGGTVAFLTLFALFSPQQLPRSLVALEFFLTTSLMGGFRFAPRLAFGWYSSQIRARRGQAQRTLIVGAGNAGDLLQRDIQRSPDLSYQLVGFVDDDRAKIGTWLGGKPVLGRLDELPTLIEKNQISTVLLAIPSLPARRIRDILNLCSQRKVSFKIIPASFVFMAGRVTAAMLHDLSPEDLLPRDEVAFDRAEVRALVSGRRILVTGGGGSIGGEIARQVVEHGCGQLVLVDMNENELYLKARRLREEHPGVDIRTEVADIRDSARLQRLGERYRPQDVFHAAAHKHVPLMEEAPEEAVKNNVLGTLYVARMAHEFGAERLVFISTDKAVRPTSVMGASKRVGELVVRDLARGSRTRMTAVRFGNVLGSAGSVVPLFKQQIERGGPVTVTHPECTRYFMTISEAVGLVLLAGLGGYGDLCVLDMGEAIKIADLAAHMITMAGCIPGEEIPIMFTGLRPGEKLYEELLTEEEEETRSVRNRILVTRSPTAPRDLLRRVEELSRLAEVGDRHGILRAIRRLVPSYRVTPNGAPAPEVLGAEVVPVQSPREVRGKAEA